MPGRERWKGEQAGYGAGSGAEQRGAGAGGRAGGNALQACQRQAHANQWLLIGSKPKHTWISRSFCRDSSSGSSSLQMEHRVVRSGGHEAGHSGEANIAAQP